ncbi:MAG: hypothetical protein ACREQF_05505, partial [Candidatus Binataceae bacterium]
LGLLIDPNWSARQSFEEFAQKAARSKRLTLTVMAAVNSDEIKRAFDEFAKKRVEILVISSAATLSAQGREIGEQARRVRLPAIFGVDRYPENGGLISY